MVGPGVPLHVAHRRDQSGVIQVLLGNVTGTERVAREQADIGEVTRFGRDVRCGHPGSLGPPGGELPVANSEPTHPHIACRYVCRVGRLGK